MVKLLLPFERVTRRICGAKYITLSLIHPYMKLLKKAFAPKLGENYNTYLNLIYGSINNNEDESDSSIESDDDKIPSGGSR